MKNNLVLNSIIQKNLPGEYCFICGGKVHHSHNTAGEIFICDVDATHQSPRAYIIDKKTKYSVEADELIHETVGSIIVKQQGNEKYFLLFLRRKFPFLYTIPAGHVETHETPEENIKREIIEETALKITRLKKLWPQENFRLYDPCRRGADHHDWHIYEAMSEGQPSLSSEGRIIGWYTEEEIKVMIENSLLTIPSAFFLEKYWEA